MTEKALFGENLVQQFGLAEVIKTRLMGVDPDEQDVHLDDDDWKAILAALDDRKRLDFLDSMNISLNRHSGTTYRWELITNHNVNRLMLGQMHIDLNDSKAHGLPSCRDAIDLKLREIEIRRAAAEREAKTA